MTPADSAGPSVPVVTPPVRIPFRQAKYFKSMTNTRAVDLVVIHSAENAETNQGAESLMILGAGGVVVRMPDGSLKEVKSSWHYAVDSNSITQSVLENDIAYHAPGANGRGIGIELCGWARQSPEEWMDDFSIKTLELAAWLTAGICIRHRLPADPLDKLGLLMGKKGITTHNAVSEAYKRSSHWDPGPHFPMGHFIDRVRWWIGVNASVSV